jgi:hypothetical protein
MADFIVGITDGYHSIAYATGLGPADREPFSISSPSALQTIESQVPSRDPALAELTAGAIANIKA